MSKVALLVLASVASFSAMAEQVLPEPFFIQSSVYNAEKYCEEGGEFAAKVADYQLAGTPRYQTRLLATTDQMDAYIINSYQPKMNNILKLLKEKSIKENGVNWLPPVLNVVQDMVSKKCLRYAKNEIPIFG